ncbi:glycoside hydrolase family protein [Aporhodopirellula aestuarii]|uniref:Glycoside hydrolase family 10 n=1 Tax=Aporhodopirellula aestuarii TaxID=2950107 RepID=A0ABT0UD60_9BACT|nr:glycoside hydrolase family 10 [Aporhodopirellula aestuarii]MCM2374974.1 glycoside hydrolase family 10 [Aporhodopirellula aestuarii]
MGQMHFHVSDAAAEFFHNCRWKDAYLCGIEGVPWQTRNMFHPTDPSASGPVSTPEDLPADFQSGDHAGGRLTLTRNVATSAKLLITCPIDGIGYRVLTTCSLRCLDTPHRLIIELARGSCYRVRTQADTWQRGGLSLNEHFDALLIEGTRHFLDALQPAAAVAAAKEAAKSGAADLVESNPQADIESAQSAIRAITILEQAAAELGELFSTQSMAFRRSREPRLSTMMAVGISPECCASRQSVGASRTNHTATPGTPAAKSGSTAMLNDALVGVDEPGSVIDSDIIHAFNAAAVRISWGDIETASGTPDFGPVSKVLDECASVGLRVIGGPVIDHREGLLPEWLTLMDNDFERLLTSMTNFVEATVNRFRGQVHLWNAASGLNVSGPMRLDDEQVMRFSIGVLQTIRRCDPTTPVIMSIEQPCGEYLARHADGISPIHFADALLRSGLGLAGIGLNFRFGYDHGETHPRSALEFAQLIDRWGTLNAPLLVQLSIPGDPGLDPAARLKTFPVSLSPETDGRADAWARQQQEFAQPLIETLLAKQIVHAVVWDGASDQAPHVMPHTGVIDASGRPRPVLSYLTKLREEMLM